MEATRPRQGTDTKLHLIHTVLKKYFRNVLFIAMILPLLSAVTKTLMRGGKQGTLGLGYPQSAPPAVLIAVVEFKKYSNKAHKDSPFVFHPPRATATSSPAPDMFQ